MKKTDYSEMTIDGLLKCFEKACLEQYDTYITDDIRKFNAKFEILLSIADDLKARSPDARRSLLRLLSNNNRQVRLQAAKCVYPVAREEAKKCLQDLAAARFPDDQSLSAGMCLYRLEEDPSCLDR